MNGGEKWAYYVHCFDEFIKARMALHAHRNELAEQVRASLGRTSTERAAALAYLPFLSEEGTLAVIPAVVRTALHVHGQTAEARKVLIRMPREAVVPVVTAIEVEVLERRDYEEYACLMHIWWALEHTERATDLAKQAINDPDEDIRDAGTAFLSFAETREE